MEHFSPYKKIKQNQKDPRLGITVNSREESPRLQSQLGLSLPSLPPYSEMSDSQNGLHSENQKRKRRGNVFRFTKKKGVETKDLQSAGKEMIAKPAESVTSITNPTPPCFAWRQPTAGKRKRVLTLSESFVNLIMVDGQKNQAEKIFSQTLKKLAEYLQGQVERGSHKKKEINLFGRGESQPFLILSDRVEKRNVYHLLQKSINNVKPTLQVRKVRIARSVYQVPFIIKKERQEKNGIRWIIEGARKKSRSSGVAFSECLASSVLEAFAGQGQAREKRDQLHRTAEANRAYLRYRWW